MKKHVLPTLLLLFTLAGCSRNLAGEEESRVAYTPIYGDKANYSEVKSEPAKAIRNGGKIVLYGNILFQVETGEGIHVFDISNPENTKRLGYIKSYMCNELAVNDGFILTNNMDDLVIINIADPGNIKVVNRMDGEFPEMAQSVPPERGVYFECPDLQKGVIIGWTKTTSRNAKCKLN